ncbi:ATP-binding protein [bacterium]|nr:ATP-binding protein [bacterium]
MSQSICAAPLAVKIEADGQWPSVKLSGRADRSNVSRLLAVLEQVADQNDRCVSLDLEDLEAMDASALQGLAKSVGEFKDRHRKLHLTATSSAVRDILDRHHLWDMFCLCKDCAHDCSPENCTQAESSWDIDVFTLDSVISNCREARHRVGRMAMAAGFSEDGVNDILLAVGEAITNAIKYGSKNVENAIFTVSCLVSEERFCISVSDNGPGFNYQEIPCFEDALFMEHGRGIYCIKALMDEVSFYFNHGCTVRMVKHKS